MERKLYIKILILRNNIKCCYDNLFTTQPQSGNMRLFGDEINFVHLSKNNLRRRDNLSQNSLLKEKGEIFVASGQQTQAIDACFRSSSSGRFHLE